MKSSGVIAKNYVKFETWYDFKKALEVNLGHFVHNDLWLQVKPKGPLPWNESALRKSLLLVSINKHRVRGFSPKTLSRHLHTVH